MSDLDFLNIGQVDFLNGLLSSIIGQPVCIQDKQPSFPTLDSFALLYEEPLLVNIITQIFILETDKTMSCTYEMTNFNVNSFTTDLHTCVW